MIASILPAILPTIGKFVELGIIGEPKVELSIAKRESSS